MTFYSPFSGPFSQIPVPSPPVIVTDPPSDNTIDIGSPTKRYRTTYTTDVKTTSIECATVTASTSMTVNGFGVVCYDGMTATGANVPKFSDTTGLLVEDSGVDATTIVTTSIGSSTDGDIVTFNGTSGKSIKSSALSAADIVQGTGGSSFGHIAQFNDNAAHIIADSGINGLNLVQNPGTSVSGNLSSFSSNSGKAIQDSLVVAANVVQATGTSVVGRLAQYADGTARLIQDSGITATALVQNTGTSTTGHLASFSSGTGKAIQDSTWKPGSFSLAQFSLYPSEPVTISNTTSTLSILGAGVGTLTIPANSTVGGSFIRIRAIAYGNIDAATSVQFILAFNANLLGLTYTSVGAHAGIWYQHDICISVTGGSADSLATSWTMTASDGTIVTAPTTGIWSTSSAQTIDFQANFSAASAGNTLSCKQFIVERGFLP